MDGRSEMFGEDEVGIEDVDVLSLHVTCNV